MQGSMSPYEMSVDARKLIWHGHPGLDHLASSCTTRMQQGCSTTVPPALDRLQRWRIFHHL